MFFLDCSMLSFHTRLRFLSKFWLFLRKTKSVMPSPSASSKFVLSVLKFLGILKFLGYTQNILGVLK